MMTEAEAKRVYDELSRMLRDNGFLWVAAQVANEIRIGRAESKKVSTRDDDAEEIRVEAGVKGGKPTTFISSIDYTARERLDLLLDALSQATAGVAGVHQATIGTLIGKTRDRGRDPIMEIDFVDPITGEKAATSTEEARESIATEAEHLRSLLYELAKEV